MLPTGQTYASRSRKPKPRLYKTESKKKRKRKRNKTKSIALIDGFPLSEQIARQTNPLTFATFYTHTTARSQCVCVYVLLQFSVKAAFATWCEHNNNIALSKRSRTKANGNGTQTCFQTGRKATRCGEVFLFGYRKLNKLNNANNGTKKEKRKKKKQ